MGRWRCCVPNCSGRGFSRRTLPYWDMKCYEIWVKRVQNPDLTMEIDPSETYRKFHVCDRHFEESCHLPEEKRLHRDSLPTLHLPPGYLRSSQDDALYRTFVNVQPGCSATPDVEPEERCQTPPPRTLPTDATSSRSTAKTYLLEGVSSSVKQLTPKARKIYKRAQHLYKCRQRLLFSKRNELARLKRARKTAISQEFKNAGLSKVSTNFILSQLREHKKLPKGRRFTVEDKTLALSIMKQSRKVYSMLQKIFTLPSRSTLLKFIRRLKFSPGLNHHIIAHLKSVVNKMSDMDRYCILMFDEMSIATGLDYNAQEDYVLGFVNDGKKQNNKCQFADHALVFMLRGVFRKWKQPISFVFTEHCTPSQQLAVLIKELIASLQKTGLHVIATVCDQGTNNVSAINHLMEETRIHFLRKNEENRCFGFLVEDKEVVPVFDPPHLLKGMRNNLLTKDAIFIKDDVQCKASWKDVILLHKLNNQYEYKKLIPALTDQHVYSDKMPKMKVSIAAKVFSQRVSSVLNFTAQYGILPPSCLGTSDFIAFIDQLFDSVNGVCAKSNCGKSLRTAISKTSPHKTFWINALRTLNSIKFVDQRERLVVPPTVTNWAKTLKAMAYLSDNLLQIKGVKYLAPRNFCQDPLENFFASIRSYRGRNVNPTSTDFISNFKSLIINNFISPRSIGANCKEDKTEGALDNLREFLESKSTLTPCDKQGLVFDNVPEYVIDEDILSRNIDTYIAGFIAKKIVKVINCPLCHQLLVNDGEVDTNDDDTMLLRKREYFPRALCTPTTLFARLFSIVYFYCQACAPKAIYLHNVKYNIVNFILTKLGDIQFSCDRHPGNIIEIIVNTIVHFFLLAYCKQINKILKGHDRFATFQDPVKIQASLKFKKCMKK